MGWPSFLPFHDKSTPSKIYQGSCHCGKFQFEFDHPSVEEGFEVLTCNCSICTAKGALYVYLPDPPNEFRVKKGSLSELADYRFGPCTVGHLFCKVCGCNLLEDILLGGAKVLAVNMRFAKDVDIKSFKLRYLDGKAMGSVITEALREMNA